MGCSSSKGQAQGANKKAPKAAGKKASPKKGKKAGKKGVASAGPPAETFKFMDPTKYCDTIKISDNNISAEGTQEGDYVVVDRQLKTDATLTFLIKKSKVLDLGVGVGQFATETEEERDLRLENSVGSAEASEEEEGGEQDAALEAAKKNTYLRQVRYFDFHFRDRMTHYRHVDDAIDEEDLDAPSQQMFKKDLALKEGDQFTIDVEGSQVKLRLGNEPWETIVDSPLLKSGEWYPMISFGDPDGDVVELVSP